jgi:hypothetical protein
METYQAWAITLFHFGLGVLMSFGVLFSKTIQTQLIVFICMLLIVLGIRHWNGCILTPYETDLHDSLKPNISELARAVFLQYPERVSIRDSEEMACTVLLTLSIFRMFSTLVFPTDILF